MNSTSRTHNFLSPAVVKWHLVSGNQLINLRDAWAGPLSPLRWRHNDHAGVSNHQPHGCLLNRLFRRKSKKTSKLRVTSLCVGNSPGTGEFPSQMASFAENVSIWWRHHANRQNNVVFGSYICVYIYIYIYIFIYIHICRWYVHRTRPGMLWSHRIMFTILRLSGPIWQPKSLSTLARVMACCLTTHSHYLK